MEKLIRQIFTQSQATHDEKIKKIADLCDVIIYNTMYYVRTHSDARSQANKHIADAVKAHTNRYYNK